MNKSVFNYVEHTPIRMNTLPIDASAILTRGREEIVANGGGGATRNCRNHRRRRCENNRQLSRAKAIVLHSDNSKRERRERERVRERRFVVVVICGRLRFRQFFPSLSLTAHLRAIHTDRFEERRERERERRETGNRI